MPPVRDVERRRLQEHVFPRPPEDVIDEAILRGFRRPEDQEWFLALDLHVECPREFRCGFHRPTHHDPGPVETVDLAGMDGEAYRVGQCPRCWRMFWGVKRAESVSPQFRRG
jgi:hypothetical protein